jgi:hypothetical protein
VITSHSSLAAGESLTPEFFLQLIDPNSPLQDLMRAFFLNV